MIDASPGLGEAIVSGLVTPDHFVVRRRLWSWHIVERRIGRCEVMVRPRAGGGTERISPNAVAISRPQLSDRAVFHLVRLSIAIQRHFGSPQDIEWAWVGGKLFILQARPITVLPEPVPHLSKRQQMMVRMIAEMLPIRPYPLDVTTWSSALFGAALGLFGFLGIARPSFEQLCVEEDGVVVRLNPPTFRLTSKLLLAPVRLLRQAWRYNPVDWQADPGLSEMQARVHALEALELHTLSWQELLAALREALAIPLLGQSRVRYYPRAVLAFAILWLWLRVLRRGNRFGVLLSGTETKTVETNQRLEALAAEIQSDPVLAETFLTLDASDLWAALEQQPSSRTFLDELRAFLDRYGHRESMALLATQPTWKDAPEIVLGLLKALAATPPQLPAARPTWKVARDELLAHPLLQLPLLRSAFLALLIEARCLPQMREDTHFYGTLPLPSIRRILIEFGRRLESCGVLDTPEDVFHLKLAELERISGMWLPPPQIMEELRAIVVRRKERRAALEGTPLVDPRLFHRTAPNSDVLLGGAPGSPGVAEGAVRIIHDASEFDKLRSGEVLVAPYTNPAWTPLFQRASAVVVDSGSAGSHAAIVAREYRIPAVMGTIDGTRRLVEGEWVRVDGARGLVFSAAEHSTGHDVKVQSG